MLAINKLNIITVCFLNNNPNLALENKPKSTLKANESLKCSFTLKYYFYISE